MKKKKSLSDPEHPKWKRQEKYYHFYVFWNRISTVKRGIGILFLFALGYILAYEFFLKHKDAPNQFYEDFGEVARRISYAYFSAFVFYFLIIHLPKEKRKAKLYLLLVNKKNSLIIEVQHLLSEIAKATSMNLDSTKLTRTILQEALFKINPHTSTYVIWDWNGNTTDWNQYLFWKGKRIRKIVNETMVHNDSIDSEYLEYLSYIDNFADFMNLGDKPLKFQNPDLSFYSVYIFWVNINVGKLDSVFKKKYHRYYIEYERNRKLMRKEYPDIGI